ncbi:MAG: PEP-CTERM sorting domain-containing protein [Deltaproteobacteria bacterium]|nr:PEP-CTERM sorting domain-containing protein [Deltaproteobacteria bacterium]
MTGLHGKKFWIAFAAVASCIFFTWSGVALAATSNIWSNAEVTVSSLSVNGAGNVNWGGSEPYTLTGAEAFSYRNGALTYSGLPIERTDGAAQGATANITPVQYTFAYANAVGESNILGMNFSYSYIDFDPAAYQVYGEGNSWTTRRFDVGAAGTYTFSLDYSYSLSGNTTVADIGEYPIYAGYIVNIELNEFAIGPESRLLLGDGSTSFLQNGGGTLIWEVQLDTGRNYDLTIGARANSEANQPVPIPGTLLLFGSGVLGLVGIGRKRLKS